MSDYFVGTDLLGDVDILGENTDPFHDLVGAGSTISVQDVTPPTVTTSPYLQSEQPVQPLVDGALYGPGSSSGTVYTDKATITAVQKKLKALGFFHGTVDGKYGPLTNAAIKNYSGKDGPPDDALLDKLGLRSELSFSDEEADSMKVAVASASTPAQVQTIAAKIENLTVRSSPQVRAQARAVKQAADTAVTPQQVEQVKKQAQVVIEKAQSERGVAGWKVGLIAGGVALGVGLIAGGIALARR
jgi:peptidoglycan hydrolase-like protein with peptidoglycan-binding domain